jgi:hypothetical protein
MEDQLKTYLENLKKTFQDKFSDINTNLTSKIDQKINQYKVIGFAMYAIPVIILFYIVYLLNKYH